MTDEAMPEPESVTAMTATLDDRRRTFDDGWVLERKYDGYRCLAWVDGAEVRLRSRNGQSFDEALPELRAALRAQVHGRAVLDGELVAMDGDRTSFGLLQRRIGSRPLGDDPMPVRFVAFDLLWFDGHDLRPLDLGTRSDALRHVVSAGELVGVAEQVHGVLPTLLEQVCRAGWEGLVAKRLASPYQPRRSRDWIKLPCTCSQEVVVGGFTEPSGSRTGLGALLVGVHDVTGLRYAGKVGSGFDADALRALPVALRSLEQASSPFVDPVRVPRAHWVAPELVAQVTFAQWTDGGRLRHPRFVGLRIDKDPSDVVRERLS